MSLVLPLFFAFLLTGLVFRRPTPAVRWALAAWIALVIAYNFLRAQ